MGIREAIARILRRRRNGNGRTDAHQILKESLLRQFDVFERRGFGRKNAGDEFFDLFRRSIADMLHIKSQFTYEEVIAELERLRIREYLKERLINFCKKMIDAEYSAARMTQEELRHFFSEIREIIQSF